MFSLAEVQRNLKASDVTLRAGASPPVFVWDAVKRIGKTERVQGDFSISRHEKILVDKSVERERVQQLTGSIAKAPFYV